MPAVVAQLTTAWAEYGVKSAHLRLYAARFFLVLSPVSGNLNNDELVCLVDQIRL